MIAEFYPEVLFSPLVLRETRAPYLAFSERHLHALWFEQKYFKGLATPSGDPIKILSPGTWNLGDGPDFLNAHLLIGDRELKGDIELHLTPQDWIHQGHHLNPLYNGVILHLSLWQQECPARLETQSRRVLPQAFLEPCLKISKARLLSLLDLDLYPYKKFAGKGRCSQVVFEDLTESDSLDILREAAEWRLEEKCRRLEALTPTPSLQFPLALAMALVHPCNANAMADLFFNLEPIRNLGDENLFVLSLESCGFFSNLYCNRWPQSAKYKELRAYSMMLAFTTNPIPKVDVSLHQRSPLIHPIRRLAYFAKFLSDAACLTLFDKMVCVWEDHWAAKRWPWLRKQLLRTIPDYKDAYWNHHIPFEQSSRRTPLALLGLSTKLEILMNAFLPLLHRRIKDRKASDEKQAFLDFFEACPAVKGDKSTYLTHRFFDISSKGRLSENALAQHGAFQMHKDHCVHYEASCEGCPFPERHRKKTY